MYLNDFFKNAPRIEINQLSCDSRLPMKNCIFFCIKGIMYNGHDFIDEAISNGANVIVYSDDIDINKNAIFVKVNNVDDVLNQVSSKFHGYPASKVDAFVIAGTDGRSSVSSIINHILSKKDKCASIGVFGINSGDKNLYSSHPTLPILDNQKYLEQFVNDGCKSVTFEATALSLSYKKLDMLKPKAFIYTNTCSDSNEYKQLGLDYYDTFKKYFYSLEEDTVVVLNMDDDSYDIFSKACSSNYVTYGENIAAKYCISNIRLSFKNTEFDLRVGKEIYSVKSPLLGEPNVYNLVAAIAALNSIGYDINYLIDSISDIECIDGIYDRLKFENYNIIVDCASAYDSVEKIHQFAKKVIDKNKRIISVISINTTDNEYRLEKLINIVDEYSDLIILTADDTYEDDINSTMIKTSSYIKKHNYLTIEDREGAIEEAIELINSDDCLLILGKGNENFMYQGLVKKTYIGDKGTAYKYMNKRLKEEDLVDTEY